MNCKKSILQVFMIVLSALLLISGWVPMLICWCSLKYPAVRDNIISVIWFIYVLALPVLILILCLKNSKPTKVIAALLGIMYVFTYISSAFTYLSADNIYYIMPFVSRTENVRDYRDFDDLSRFDETFDDAAVKSIKNFLPEEIPNNAEYEYYYSPGFGALKIRVKFKPESEDVLSQISMAGLGLVSEGTENGNNYFYYSSPFLDLYTHICLYENGDIEYLVLVRMASASAYYEADFYCPEEIIIM